MPNKWGRRSVSSTESFLSAFGFVYTFLGLYVITNVLLFLNAAVVETRRHEDFEKYITGIARGSGATLNFNMAVVILLASRSAMGLLRQTPLTMVLPIDKAMPGFHRIVGIFVVFAGALHSIMHWVRLGIKKNWSTGYSGQTSLFASGVVLLVTILAIRLSARPVVYQSNYELFYRVHVGGSIIAFITIIIHGLHYGVPNTWKWVVFPVLMYVLDIGYRHYRQKRSYLLVSKHSAVFQGPDILKIRLPRVLHFRAGQYAELKVPELSYFQWHPFTIASAPHESEMTFYIKAVGNWTTALYNLFRERLNNNEGMDIEVHIRGPFGAPAQHVGQFDRILLIGGGVGATPFCSVVKDAYHWITNWTPTNKKKNRRKPHRKKHPRYSGQINRAMGRDEKPVNIIRKDSFQEPLQLPREKSKYRAYSNPERNLSNIFATNVFTEQLDSLDLEQQLHYELDTELNSMSRQSTVREYSAYADVGLRGTSESTFGELSMNTAKDHLSTVRTQSSASENNSRLEGKPRKNGLDLRIIVPVHDQPTEQIIPMPLKAAGTISKTSKRPKMSYDMSSRREHRDHDGMGSYRENSIGMNRGSFDYMDALHAAYSEAEVDAVYQKSLDMMVGMSFGSVPLVRKVQQRKREQHRLHQPEEADTAAADKEDLKIFQDPLLMLLLFMRSVTVNMLLLWVLLLRYVIAGTTFVFGGLTIFEDGLALYKSQALTGIDLLLVFIISLAVAVPSVLEVAELGAAPVHGYDLFVLFPIATFSVVADILALAKVGTNVSLIGVVHIFVLWPLLGIFILARLLREIGERVAQAENFSHTHTSTKAVDFYWTAPTPADDRWLVDELVPFADIDSVRMHRHLTRCTSPTPETESAEQLGEFLFTNYGRPDWQEILNETAEKSTNNTTIGVFFCGPHTMGAQVQNACMGAMRNSIVRGLQTGTRAMRGLEEVFGDAVSANEYTGEVINRRARGARGCNVKFVFKRESFA